MSRLSRQLTRLRVQAGYRWRFAESHHFVDRSRGQSKALLVLAGHKPLLWPMTLDRIQREVPPDVDVCVISPGQRNDALARLAEARGWSYLSTAGGHVSVAQNIALRALPSARLVFKLDEDMFVPRGFFAGLEEGFKRVQRSAEFAVGFCAPTINVNGYSYVDFLRAIGAEDEYVKRFGPVRRASDGIPAQQDGDAAVWLWERSLPVDRIGEQFAARPFGYSIVPHRFSIGAIVFARDLWEEMRGFKRLDRAPGLGEDEQHICTACLSSSRIMAVVDNVYAGHFAFGPQYGAMAEAFGGRLQLLSVNDQG